MDVVHRNLVVAIGATVGIAAVLYTRRLNPPSSADSWARGTQVAECQQGQLPSTCTALEGRAATAALSGATCSKPLTMNSPSRALHCSSECRSAQDFTCSPNVAVKQAPGSSYGLFARKSFAVGDCLESEAPLFLVENSCYQSATTQAEAVQMVEDQACENILHLSEARRLAVMGLSDSHAPEGEASTALGIWRTNAMPGSGHSGLFALCCRMNHSCQPNARWCWRRYLGRQLIIAMRPIRAGDEVTVSYISQYGSRATRQQRLREKFHFTCTCPLCQCPDATVDALMIELQSCIDRLPEACRSDLRRALHLSERTLQLLAEAALDTPVAMRTSHY